jgi:acetyl-CoA carboxylase biotin carboxyl carrier protein
MDTKDIQQLIDFIAQSNLDEVNIETSDLKISVKRYAGQLVAPAPVPLAAPTPVALPVAAAPAPVPSAAAPASTPATATPSNLVPVPSPMIGTFYRSSSPDSPALVSVGDEIKPGQVLCIIEAMKLFNEIESEVSGRVVKILVENATPVEFDQPLFLVEPI